MTTEDDGTITRILNDDYSYLKLLAISGGDQTVIEAARTSTDKGFQGWGTGDLKCVKCGLLHHESVVHVPNPCEAGSHDFRKDIGDEKLLAYLWHHKHLSPFEMVQIRIEVQAPIFVFREWHRHRTQSYNELSARYTPLPDHNYIPTVERILLPGGANKQAQGAKPVTRLEAETFQDVLAKGYDASQAIYEVALNAGVPKELARVIVPVGRYSRMQASANLRNWLHFLELRMDVHAQWEIRQYANALGSLIEKYLPRTWALFEADFEPRPR